MRKPKRRATRRAPTEPIAATDAAKNFGRLVDRVRQHQATYVIERHGRPAAQIGPVEPAAIPKTFRNLVEHLRTAPTLNEEVLRAIEEGLAVYNRPEVPQNPWER